MPLNSASLDLEKSSSQFASITDALQTGLTINGDMTIEAWIKIEAGTDDSNFEICGRYDSGANEIGYTFGYENVGVSNLVFAFSVNGATLYTRTQVVTHNEYLWHHVAVTRDVTLDEIKFFVDGIQVGSTQTSYGQTLTHASIADFRIGVKDSAPWHYMDGKIDEVRVWDDVRSPAEILANYNIHIDGSLANLKGYWRLNTDYVDETSNDNDLTPQNGPTFSSDTPFAGSPTYLEADQSIHDGSPIELYKFEGPTAALTYFYTSYQEDVAFGGDTYTAVSVERDVIGGSTHNDPPELSIKLPVSLDLVQEYAFKTPPRSLELTIYRLHTPTGEDTEYWKGIVTGITVQGDIASCRSPSLLDDPMRSPVSNVYFQGICNHVLFDARCTKSAASYKTSTTVSSISGKDIVVADDGGNPDDYYKGGEIIRVSDGERRLIISNEAASNTITINKRFRSLAATDAVELYAGCDHKVGTCRDKFSNVANFGGHPYIPIANPFLRGLKGVD